MPCNFGQLSPYECMLAKAKGSANQMSQVSCSMRANLISPFAVWTAEDAC